ncbi:hypothetical protein DFP73DRAFT_612189 [Morchella snyderi]|nr:hypothetical protein DFP73DRAFT_612189 [Morchella snyderi]
MFTSCFWMQVARYSAEYEYIYLMSRKGGAPYGHTSTDLCFVAWPFRDLWQGIKGIYRNRYDDVSNYVDLNTTLALYASQIYLYAWLFLPSETYDSWSTTIVCVSIMIPCEVIMISAILLILYCRSRPLLPRQPITLASKLEMVYATNIIRVDSITDLEEAETPQASEAVTQPPPSFQGSLNPSENSETATQEINTTGITDIPSTELPNPSTSLSTVNNSPQISQRWWNLRSRKDKSKRKRRRSWLDLAEPGDSGVCAFGNFEGRDGKQHVGIGKHGAGMTEYTISKERQKKIDEGSTYESIAGTA